MSAPQAADDLTARAMPPALAAAVDSPMEEVTFAGEHRMFDYIAFERIAGASASPELKLFVLSTCAFCEQAKAFLGEQGLAYSMTVVDLLPNDVKRRVRNEFVRELSTNLRFPTLVVDDRLALAGFDRSAWTEALLRRS
jgi:glutaredoxin